MINPINRFMAEDAWLAYDKGDFEQAELIWQALLARPQEYTSRIRYQQAYAHVLIATGRFVRAERLLQELHAQTGQPRYLHQLGCLARYTGQFKKARELFLAERGELDAHDHQALAINAHELSLTSRRLKEWTTALDWAEIALSQARLAQDLTSQGMALRMQGDLLLTLHQPERAIECYRAARQAFATVDDRQAKADAEFLINELEAAPQARHAVLA